MKTIDGITDVSVDYTTKTACVETTRAITDAEISAALESDIYSLNGTEVIPTCAPGSPVRHQDPWADTTGVDAQIISQGERFTIREHRTEEKYTIFDFGASWCAPCHVAADRLREELNSTSDLSVRIISLGEDPQESFELPVAIQHLSNAAGIPWFIVYPPSGRSIYEGPDVEAALVAIAAQREKENAE